MQDGEIIIDEWWFYLSDSTCLVYIWRIRFAISLLRSREMTCLSWGNRHPCESGVS